MTKQLISILMLIRQWQNSQGVASQNFNGYRRFAKNKQKKLRKQMGMSFGRKFDKKKFHQQVFEAKNFELYEDVQRELFIQYFLLLLEKNYSYYLEHKSSVSMLRKPLVKKRLKRAVDYLERFLKTAKPFL
jgi:hypothetical protein